MTGRSHSGGGLSRDAQSILEAGRDLDGPGDLERARVRRSLLAKVAAGGVTAIAASTASGTASGAAGGLASSAGVAGAGGGGLSAAVAAPLAKILIPLAVLIAGGVGGTIAWHAKARVDAPQTATTTPMTTVAVAMPAPSPMPSPTLAPAPLPAPAEHPSLPRHRAHVALPVRDAEPANRLAEETALLAASNAELRDGDARRALTLLNDYEVRYPSGVLREEVLATRVIARCELGVTPDAGARRAADTFLTRHAASPLAPRVRASCAR
jgi:hypothetical protein